MSIAERPASRTTFSQARVPRNDVLLVVIACTILALHVAIGAFVLRALPGEQPDQKETIIFRGD